MKPCSYRRILGVGSILCANPRITAPNHRVTARLCALCPYAEVEASTPARQVIYPRGLGDTTAAALEWVGWKKKPGCGCPVRQLKLNAAVSYERLPEFAQKSPVWRVLLWSLLKLLRLRTGFERETVLFRFAHGLGDAVQFTAVLAELGRRYPRTTFDVVVKRGQDTCFDGLVRHAFAVGHAGETDTARPTIDGHALSYDHEITVPWHEPTECYGESPSTKAEKYLREAHGLTPPAKTRYTIAVRREAHERAVRYLREVCPTWNGRGKSPAVLLHYQGNSAPSRKSLKTPDVAALANLIAALGFVPVLLDWDRRSGLVRDERRKAPALVNPPSGHWLWPEGIGDAETIAALARLTRLNVGIDSGPGKVFEAVAETPAVIVWTRMHPVHYSTPAEHVLHLVRHDHRKYLRGDPEPGDRFFRKHYRHAEYSSGKLRERLLDLVRQELAGATRGELATLRARPEQHDLRDRGATA